MGAAGRSAARLGLSLRQALVNWGWPASQASGLRQVQGTLAAPSLMMQILSNVPDTDQAGQGLQDGTALESNSARGGRQEKRRIYQKMLEE